MILKNRYQLQERLSQKAGREVFLAIDQQTEQQVIVKILWFGQNLTWADIKLFKREIKTLKTLSHPAIPRYLDYIEINSQKNKGIALVQTYIRGKSLEQYLQSGHGFSEAELRQIAQKILEILIYLHGHRPPLIHRDIKPSNILLADGFGDIADQIHLVDFGAVGTQTMVEKGTMTLVGSYGYMPPEQFTGHITPAVDIYGLGATLIYLVTGKHPTELPQKNLQIQFRSTPNISPAFTKWLKQMTEPHLEKRLPNAQVALAKLQPKFQLKPYVPAIILGLFVMTGAISYFALGTNILSSKLHKEIALRGDFFGLSPTGIYVKAGQVLRVRASGVIIVWPNHGSYGEATPAGNSNTLCPHAECFFRGGPAGLLVGKISASGELFEIGADKEITVINEGELYLGINDPLTGDNSGHFSISVDVR
ncbi:protein kinase [Microcoleus sp. Pol7_A1]|uniref:protein kinase domain-containing protein n=1 Tax=Microcoleus sp. Pol7_A1 TaxID=2818893 RepID=UPI002FD21444